jgi:hypothetical protein
MYQIHIWKTDSPSPVQNLPVLCGIRSHNRHKSTDEQTFKCSACPGSRKFSILNKRKPYPLTYIGMVIIRDLMVYNNILAMNEKHKR